MSIVILDYGIGNLRSVQKAFEKIGAVAEISNDLGKVGEAERLVLPGVGAFCDCMDKLLAARLREPVLEHIRKDKPFLGICVGMQMLFTTGYENGEHAGLGVLQGDVVRFPATPGLKVPHMGWNQTVVKSSHPMWHDMPKPLWFYYVHSYYCRPSDPGLLALEADYGSPFCAAVQRGQLLATQFHPEKSQQAGLMLLKKFVEL